MIKICSWSAFYLSLAPVLEFRFSSAARKPGDRRITGGDCFLNPHKILLKDVCYSGKPYGVGKRLRATARELYFE